MRPAWQTALSAASSLLMVGQHACAYDLNINSTDSIKGVSKQMAADLMSLYHGNEPGQTPGLLPQPYYWWEAGALMGAMIDYWYYTGDDTYNQVTQDGLLFQVGPLHDYMPPNQTLTEGNDDQGFWGMAVMTAAEYKFPNPPANQPQWLALAQAVFNTQAARWDTQYCGGGLRWQIFQWNNGYTYKNSISQGCFFNMAARLALYTGNSSYADWAMKTWDWMRAVKLMDDNYFVFDGGHIEDGCTSLTPYQFSYNAGSFLLGAAAMYAWAEGTNRTSDRDMWAERVDGLLNGTEEIFFYRGPNGTDPPVMYEVACEGVGLCNLDQQSFKAYLARWMAATTKWAPWTYDRIRSLLQTSAQAAAAVCTGGQNKRMCGLKWANNSGVNDGILGVGEQMAAMEVVLANMIHEAETPVTNDTGGISSGNSAGGGPDIGRTDPTNTILLKPIGTGDLAGAIICTIIVCGAMVTAVVFMMTDETQSGKEYWDNLKGSIVMGPGTNVLAKGGRGSILDEKEKGKGKSKELATDVSSMDSGEKFQPTRTTLSSSQPSEQTRRPERALRHSRRTSAVTLSDIRESATIWDDRGPPDSVAKRRSLQEKSTRARYA